MSDQFYSCVSITPCRYCGLTPEIQTKIVGSLYFTDITHDCKRLGGFAKHYGFKIGRMTQEDSFNEAAIDWNERRGSVSPEWYNERNNYLEDRFGGAASSKMLKPCPFCGGHNLRFRSCYSDAGDETGAYIICNDCLSMYDQAEASCREDLIECWNNRARASKELLPEV